MTPPTRMLAAFMIVPPELRPREVLGVVSPVTRGIDDELREDCLPPMTVAKAPRGLSPLPGNSECRRHGRDGRRPAVTGPGADWPLWSANQAKAERASSLAMGRSIMRSIGALPVATGCLKTLWRT